jgi:hypothetical protein
MNRALPSTSHSISSGSKQCSITHVTVLEDLPSNDDDANLDVTCRPLLVAKKGETIEVVDKYSNTIWVGVLGDRQGAFKLDRNVVCRLSIIDSYLQHI